MQVKLEIALATKPTIGCGFPGLMRLAAATMVSASIPKWR